MLPLGQRKHSGGLTLSSSKQQGFSIDSAQLAAEKTATAMLPPTQMKGSAGLCLSSSKQCGVDRDHHYLPPPPLRERLPCCLWVGGIAVVTSLSTVAGDGVDSVDSVLLAEREAASFLAPKSSVESTETPPPAASHHAFSRSEEGQQSVGEEGGGGALGLAQPTTLGGA